MLDRWSAAWRACPRPAPSDRPGCWSGDFNATLDHAELRDVIDRGYRDAGDETGDGPDAAPGRRATSCRRPVTIDHILADERFGIVGLRGRGPAGQRPPRGLRAAGADTRALRLHSRAWRRCAAALRFPAGGDLFEAHPAVVGAERRRQLVAADLLTPPVP